MRNEKELDGLKMEGEAKMTDNKPAKSPRCWTLYNIMSHII